MNDRLLWAEVYLQNIRAGIQHDQAAQRATDAVAKRNESSPGTD